MAIMSNRILISLTISLSFVVTSIYSYDHYGRYYGPRDESLRQVRRCPTCPPDCPESLASPWYGSPMVYGQVVESNCQATNRNVDQSRPQEAIYSGRSEASNIYGSSYYGQSNPYESRRCSCKHGGCGGSIRSPRSEKYSMELHVDENSGTSGLYNSPKTSSAIVRGSYIPETYQEMDDVELINPTDNNWPTKYFGNPQKDTISGRPTSEESSEANESKWKNVASLIPREQSVEAYKRYPESIMYENPLKSIELPSKKKVFVVYRADVDDEPITENNDDFERSLIDNNSRDNYNYGDNGMIDSSSSTISISHSQLEEIVRNAVAAATRNNINTNLEQNSNRQQRRGINYNEHARNNNEDEYYNTQRRPYNDDLYQRFNVNDQLMDEEEMRKMYMPNYSPTSEIIYKPIMRYNPYLLSGNEEYRDKNNVQAQLISDTDQVMDEYTSREGVKTISEEFGEISTEKEEEDKPKEMKNDDEKSFEKIQDLMPIKREIDLEKPLLPPPINYRTHNRNTQAERVEDKQQDEKTSKPLEENMEKDNQAQPIDINPDLTEDMEIPPIDESEHQLQLSFQPFDNTTPLPTD